MELDIKLLQDIKRLLIVRYPTFASQIASVNLEYNTNLKYHTAATDGETIFFDPNFLSSLNNDDKIFIIAHELMHIKFEHMFRINTPDGKIRDLNLWNTATDAIINANLERDGFKIKEGYVNIPEALNYNAEELYEILLKEKQEREQNQQSENGQSQGRSGQKQQDNQNGQDNTQQHKGENNNQENSQKENKISGDNKKQTQGSRTQSGEQSNSAKQDKHQNQSDNWKQFSDDHSLWEKAYKKRQKQGNKIGQNSNKNQNSHSIQESKDIILDPNAEIPEFDEVKFDEREQFKKNRQERLERAKRDIERLKDQELKKSESGNIAFGDVGQAKPILDWKLLLRREIEKTETIWSQRRSIAENNYAYRLEENDIENQAETEVMIDVSGSVSLEMIKAFLRQLKPILKESKLKIGFFSDYATKNFLTIEKEKDIDNLKLPFCGGGTNLDAPVRAFSKKRENNKIIFTDGYCYSNEMPKKDLENVNCIWIVYGNREFYPCCGKVIDINVKDLKNINSQYHKNLDEFEQFL